MTETQLETLRWLADEPIEGRCEKYVWKFLRGHKNVTRSIKALEERSLAHVAYYRNGAAANITDIGRNVLAAHTKGESP